MLGITGQHGAPVSSPQTAQTYCLIFVCPVLGSVLRGYQVDETGSGSYPVAGFDNTGVVPFSSTTKS
jgi:hypothetical protein